jgi:sugar phosphate isomerase/epimerase
MPVTDATRLSRRNFLGAATALAMVPAIPAGARNRPAWFEDIAAQAFGIRTQLIADFPRTLRRLRAMGLRRLELVSFKGWDGHPYGSFTPLAGMSGERVHAALSAAGMHANSSHVLPRELMPDHLHRTLEWMEPIGVKTLIMTGLPIGEDKSASLLQMLDQLNDTGRRLSDKGFRLMLHGDYALWATNGQGRNFDEYLRRVDPASCRLQLDLGAVLQMGADARKLIREHGGRLGSVHLRDAKPPFDPNVYVPSLALGKGVAPIEGIVEDSIHAGIRDFVLEMVMRPEGGELAAIAQSRAFLSRLSLASSN